MTDQAFTIVQITYTAAIPVILAWLGSLIKRQTAGQKADCLLLRKALIDLHDEAMEKGVISQANYQAFEDIWKVYHHTYNGNTLTDKFHDEVNELPIE